MFCRNCSKELTGSPEFCFNCGTRPLAGNSFCHGCGAPTSPLAEFCDKCGARLAKAEAVVAEGISGKLIAGGILGIIAGAASLSAAIVILARADFSIEEGGPIMRNIPDVVGAVIGLILGILGITGCSYALARKSFRFSLAGGVCAVLATIFSLSFVFIVPTLLGISALVLIALSKDEFK